MGMLEELSYGQQYISEWVVGFWAFGFIALARSGWIKNLFLCKILFIVGLLPVAAILLFWLLPFAVVFLAPLGVMYLIFMIIMNLIDLHQQKNKKDSEKGKINSEDDLPL